MAEQLVAPQPAASPRSPREVGDPSSSSAASAASHDALKEAMRCLGTSGRRLRRGNAESTDEVLNLLRAAACHIQRSLQADAAPGAVGAE